MNLTPIPSNLNLSGLNENSIPTVHEEEKPVHEKEKLYRFTRSNAALSRKIIFDNHESGVHERPKNVKLTKSKSKSREKIFVCKFCEKRFTESQSVKYHELIHTGEKPHACKYCEKKFIQPNSVQRHELIHTGEKPYSCKTCAYRCRERANLKKHEILHTGEKPFACKFCDVRFSTKQTLKTHEKSKTHIFMVGKTPKKTARAMNLTPIPRNSNLSDLNENSIPAVHEEKKPYKCSSCSAAFSRRYHLNRHVSGVHENKKPFQCGTCLIKFLEEHELKRHIFAVHEKKKLHRSRRALEWSTH